MKNLPFAFTHKPFLKIPLLLVFLLAQMTLVAQSNDTPVGIEEGIRRYTHELDTNCVGTLTMEGTRVTVSNQQIESVWVVNPAYPNVPFGTIEILADKTIIDLSEAPEGNYYVQGKKEGRVLTYRVVQETKNQ